MRFAIALLGLPLLATPPTFTVQDAIQAEWKRQSPSFSELEKSQLSESDRTRLDLTLKRIGAPNAPALLPPELDKPTAELWEAKAIAAKTPQERFTALFFLNRLKSAKALMSLEGLRASNAKTWPKHLHLEASIATARLNGGEVKPELQGFLDGLEKAGKADPVRAQAAMLRLRIGGKKTGEPKNPENLFERDAWLQMPWAKRKETHRTELARMLEAAENPPIPLASPNNPMVGQLQRLIEGLPEDPENDWVPRLLRLLSHKYVPPMLVQATLSGLAKQPKSSAFKALPVRGGAFAGMELAMLRRQMGEPSAEILRKAFLQGVDPLARAAAIEDLSEAPADIEALIQRLWKTEEYDGVQILLQSLEKWKLPEDRRKAILLRFLEHPCWTARLDAWTALRKLDTKTPWPTAPEPTPTDEAILREATRLTKVGKPVRLRLTFAGRRQIVLKLDAVNAPMNVANLVILARKGYFNGRLVPRVVPDFVVQMGSPCDTMDGGPGYTVRCENSLTWYGPGSVGMALSGKDTGGSQFFITTNATPHLTGKYTRLGEVEDLNKALKILDDLELGAKLERVDVLVPGMKR
ncbi:MAG: peptidylprolyl isomerase [Holophaga sp.]|nr:peptidylprolyl isomerase [Holophaga sp.]